MATLTLLQEHGYAEPGQWPGSERSVGAEGGSRRQGITGACSGSPMLEATPLTIYPLRHFFLIKEDKYSNSTLGFSGTLNLHCNFLESV